MLLGPGFRFGNVAPPPRGWLRRGLGVPPVAVRPMPSCQPPRCVTRHVGCPRLHRTLEWWRYTVPTCIPVSAKFGPNFDFFLIDFSNVLGLDVFFPLKDRLAQRGQYLLAQSPPPTRGACKSKIQGGKFNLFQSGPPLVVLLQCDCVKLHSLSFCGVSAITGEFSSRHIFVQAVFMSKFVKYSHWLDQEVG